MDESRNADTQTLHCSLNFQIISPRDNEDVNFQAHREKAPYLKAKNSYLIKHPVITIALNERVVIMILSREI